MRITITCGAEFQVHAFDIRQKINFKMIIIYGCGIFPLSEMYKIKLHSTDYLQIDFET